MIRLLAADPGGKHCGYAWWCRNTGPRADERGAGTMDPAEFCEFVDAKLEQFVREAGADNVTLIIEEFRLYSGQAMAQAWSQMMTSEVIGALKWIAKLHGVKWVEQGATIKKPTKAQLKPRRIEFLTGDVHSKDAQLHLLHYALKEGLWV